MPVITGICDWNHRLGCPALVRPVWTDRVGMLTSSPGIERQKVKSPTLSHKTRQGWAPRPLLGEAVGLRDCSEGDRVLDI
jgi:hypothetical protein